MWGLARPGPLQPMAKKPALRSGCLRFLEQHAVEFDSQSATFNLHPNTLLEVPRPKGGTPSEWAMLYRFSKTKQVELSAYGETGPNYLARAWVDRAHFFIYGWSLALAMIFVIPTKSEFVLVF